jgi:hypothetical protein
MRRIHKGSFYKQTPSKYTLIVIATESIERTSITKYLFEGVVLIDTFNPSNVGSKTTMHSHGVTKTDLTIEIEKSKK